MKGQTSARAGLWGKEQHTARRREQKGQWQTGRAVGTLTSSFMITGAIFWGGGGGIEKKG